jgi:cysteine synthase A
MRFLGAKVVLTPAALKGSGMLAKAVELAQTHGWFLCRQFENEANADIHSRTTAQEILAAFEGERLDYFVTGFGTGGTLKGVARVLRKNRPETQVIVCEPDNSQLLGSGIPQPRNADRSIAGSHPNFRPHLMQGWSPDFVPKLTEDAVALKLIDRIVPVNGAQSLKLARELAQTEGIFVGISGGATFAGALQMCDQAPAGATVLCMLPDTGERYLTTPLFSEIPVDMTEEELAIARSTPNYRFDVSPAAPPTALNSAPQAIMADATEFVTRTIADTERPVVMFALEWCEFCWSVRKMFAKHDIPYRSIDLDSVEYQKANRGAEIRAALTARTSVNTIPQIFVGGEYVGGCTDVFDAHKDGRLGALLNKHHVSYNRNLRVDAYSFLPSWLHPRH